MLITTRKGPAKVPDTGWHNHSGANITKLEERLRNKLTGHDIAVTAPDGALHYLLSGNLLQLTGSLRKIILNKPRDLFIIVKHG